jgi:DnaJ family protein C protein 19
VSKLLVAIAILVGIWWMNQRRRGPSLSVREARDLLEVRGDADVEDIRAAHRRLMTRVHPDAGGSAALASRVNAARDLLVTEYNRTRG